MNPTPGAAMPLANPINTLRGGCHCDRLRLEFVTGRDFADLVPRACDCSFCDKHGAAYVSDSAGRLSISETEPGALHEYRQGSNTARFLACRHCGVLVAVVFEHESRLYGAANARCLDERGSLANAVVASPQTLSPEEKVARWVGAWVPDVVLSSARR